MNGVESGHPVSVVGVTRWLFGGAVGFALVNGVLGLLQTQGVDDEAAWFRMLDLNVEGNVPTWYTSVLLALAALAAVLVVKSMSPGQPYRRHWMGVVAIFTYLSIDEASKIHETWIDLVSLEGFESAVDVLWVVPALVLAAVIGSIYFRFWMAQDRPVKLLMLVAAVLYVGGAVGFELVGHVVVDRIGAGVVSGLVVILEETFEMFGAILFLYAWLIKLRSMNSRLVFDLV